MTKSDRDVTTRFSDRVDDYVRYRPSYPPKLVSLIADQTGILPPAQIADIGSGTGISSALFLNAGYEVWGVEPNAAMRSAAEARFADEDRFHSVSGTAEDTLLPASSCDLIVAAQAFHWFDIPQTRTEFRRILRPPGWVALIWNSRRLSRTPFLRDYEQLLLDHSIDYSQVRHENVDARALGEFFGGPYQQLVLEHAQSLDLDGLRGRLRSTSYVPGPDHPNHGNLLAAADRLFDLHAEAGEVVLEYDVRIYVGCILP
ncbi:MAG: hypothetical protein B7Z55_01910 [Planctomycetales bacterium 12-60-4]|nr:MAG: hypothetical protein B7Z55_01910 [Planctomycetales bacterium 12-60-4]